MASNNQKSFTPEQQAAYRDRVKEITNQLEDGIKNLFQSDQYKLWLDTMSKFHTYSVNNAILIMMQKPDATLVAGYNAWKNNFGRMVNKGEKAIHILAPAPYKQKVEIDRIDPYTQEVVRDDNGNPLKDTVEITRPAFRIVNVFDISQTDGKEIPTIGPDELTGDVELYDQFLEALKRSCPVPVSFEPIEGGAKGYYHQVEKRIVLQEGMSQMQTIKTLIHEMTHQKLHDKETGLVTDQTREGKEVEAESVAYTVCKHYGLDTGDYSFGYIAGWSQGKEMEELKNSLQTIRRTAADMITEINQNMQEITSERRIESFMNDRNAQAQNLAEKLDRFMEAMDPVDYWGEVESRQEHVEMIERALLTGNKDLQGIVSWIEEMKEENPSPDMDIALKEIREFTGLEETKEPTAPKRKHEEVSL